MRILQRPPVPAIIEHARRLLEQAESGELQGLCSFATTAERQVQTTESGEWPPGDVMLAVEIWRQGEVERFLRKRGLVP